MTLALVAGWPRAGEAAARPTAADSAAVRAALRAPIPPAPGRFDAPRWVMLRSLAVPGWGQAHNGAWIKGAVIATGEIWLGSRVIGEEGKLKDLEDEVNRLPVADPSRNALVERYNARLDRQTSRQWLLAALVTYSLLDAYVDAHFRGFGIALQPTGEGAGADGTGMRVAVWGRF